uniref:Oxysterol-binding protein n=1 Tax=Macrostomum lignano TaxID=282301 RepID=A0A1I8G5Y3_9PLAT
SDPTHTQSYGLVVWRDRGSIPFDSIGALRAHCQCALPVDERVEKAHVPIRTRDLPLPPCSQELTKIAMPVNFNEPLSFLQRICEYLEYSELLFQAEQCDCPTERLELIAAFAVSAVSSNWDRLGKPFNPLMGETYELDRVKDLGGGFRMVCEQVSHHPPISAFHAESSDSAWRFHGSVTPRLSFWGKSVEVCPKGWVTLEFPRRGEVYTWQNVQCKIHNIIIGKLWIEHFGDMTITCHGSGRKAELSWHPASWLSPSHHRVDGYVPKLRPSSFIAANSISSGSAGDESPSRKAASDSEDGQTGPPSRGSAADLRLPGQRLLWQLVQRPQGCERYYSFTRFAMQLNDCSDAELMARLPPTDARRKPDVRALEAGDLALAQAEKSRLEEKQRRRRAQSDSDGVWFRRWRNPHTGKDGDWRFTGEYWARDWARCPDIY